MRIVPEEMRSNSICVSLNVNACCFHSRRNINCRLKCYAHKMSARSVKMYARSVRVKRRWSDAVQLVELQPLAIRSTPLQVDGGAYICYFSLFRKKSGNFVRLRVETRVREKQKKDENVIPSKFVRFVMHYKFRTNFDFSKKYIYAVGKWKTKNEKRKSEIAEKNTKRTQVNAVTCVVFVNFRLRGAVVRRFNKASI